jgi:hypothetical protein
VNCNDRAGNWFVTPASGAPKPVPGADPFP